MRIKVVDIQYSKYNKYVANFLVLKVKLGIVEGGVFYLSFVKVSTVPLCQFFVNTIPTYPR
jgi:hypothetical protein